MKDQIIFVHGALSSSNSWNFLLMATDERVMTNYDTNFFEYKVTKESADDLVNRLVKLVKSKTKDGSHCFLIGHSFGGVLAIDAVQRLKENSKTNDLAGMCTVMTLSSPLGGSGAASFLSFFKPVSMLFKNVGSYGRFMTAFKRQKLPCRVYSIITHSVEHVDFIPGSGKNDGVVTVESQEAFTSDPMLSHKYIECNHFEILMLTKISVLLGELLNPDVIVQKRFEEKFSKQVKSFKNVL